MNLATVKELSEFLKVKPPTIYSWVHNRTIPFIKLNGLLRFDMDAITRWVEDSKPKPQKADILLKKATNLDINSIVKRAVASTRPRRYNPDQRETSLNQGLGKEDSDGTV